MFCPRCGQAIVAGAAFCMRCGQALTPAPVSAPQAAQNMGFPDPAQRNRTAMWSIVAAAGALVVIFFGLSAAGILKFGSSKVDPSLTARGITDVPAMRTSTTDNTPAMQTPASATMPDDIRAWLEHLEKTEAKRQALAQEQIMQLVVVKAGLGDGGTGAVLKGLLGEANGEAENPPTKQVQSSMADLRRPWRELVDFFNSVTPPAECAPIRDKYDQPLRETSAVINDVNSILDGAQSGGDPTELLTKLNVIFESHKSTIDKPALETDVMVDQICQKYNTRKWFQIVGNVGGSSSLRSGGF